MVSWRNEEFGYRHFQSQVSTEHKDRHIYQVARKADLQAGSKAEIRNGIKGGIYKEGGLWG